MLEGFFNIIFGWAIDVGPLFGLIIISFILTLFITLIYKYATDQEVMKSLKAELKELQKEMKALKDHPQEMMKVQKRAMEKNMKYMMQSFKPMLITFLPIIIVFGWLRNIYTPFGDIFLGFGWLGNYIIFSVAFSFLLRKLMKVH